MSTVDRATYSEAAQEDNARHIPFAHLSIETGRFPTADLLNGEERIRMLFRQIAPWIDAAAGKARMDFGVPDPRVSTCFLIDDYLGRETSPGKVVEKLARIAAEYGVTIDYVVRESGCDLADGVPLADMVAATLLPEPFPGADGSRPPAQESGWLSNGQRSPDQDQFQAMRAARWHPPAQFGAHGHSIFLDIELWKEIKDQVDGGSITRRVWARSYLATIWHLLRLGMLRYNGDPVAAPQPWAIDEDWPDRWDALPAVLRLNPSAAPFAAYRSTSILPRAYLDVEHAADAILNHLDLDGALAEQATERCASEGVLLPRHAPRRITHVFVDFDDSPGSG